MLQRIDNLDEFIKYCNSLIKDEELEDNTSWFLHVIALDATKEEILKDVKTNLDIYYKWLNKAVEDESYISAGIIYQAIAIENEHYTSLGKYVLKSSLRKDIKTINEKLKNKYL